MSPTLPESSSCCSCLRDSPGRRDRWGASVSCLVARWWAKVSRWLVGWRLTW